MEDHEKFNPCFDVFAISANAFFRIINKSTDEELGAYTREFFISMMSGVHMNDAFFEYTLNNNIAYQTRKAKKEEEARVRSERWREENKKKASKKTEPAKPAPPKPAKFNVLEAVESFARSDEEQEVLTEFVKMRAEKKKPVSRIAFNALAKKLGDLSVDDSVASVRKSIENDWQGIFPESLKPRAFEREKSGAEKFIERVLREDLEEKNRQLKLKNEVKYELKGS